MAHEKSVFAECFGNMYYGTNFIDEYKKYKLTNTNIKCTPVLLGKARVLLCANFFACSFAQNQAK